jgi:hypothetical protein
VERAKLGEGKGAKLGEGKGAKLGEGKGAKRGEGCPKVRLSQDRMPIPFHLGAMSVGEMSVHCTVGEISGSVKSQSVKCPSVIYHRTLKIRAKKAQTLM